MLFLLANTLLCVILSISLNLVDWKRVCLLEFKSYSLFINSNSIHLNFLKKILQASGKLDHLIMLTKIWNHDIIEL